jgi:ABC-2 type transport system ATP-binding protein
MIRLQNVTYGYDKTPILQDVSLTEHEPVITGMWGRNGAGKTTLMKLLAGHQQPNQGRIKIMGRTPYNNEQAVQHVCYMQEEHPFSMIWTVHDALRFGSYFNANWDQKLAEHLLKIFKLDANKKVSKLSKGMKGAVQFIIGLASHASVTILDEPINGLDAGMRKKMYEALRESHEENPRLILLSTHHIEEVQPICETLVVVHGGRIQFHQPMDEIRKRGIWLAGEKSKVEKVIKNEQILEQSEVGSMMKVMIDAPFSNKWKEHARAYGLSVENAKTQDYLLNMTDEEEVLV